MKMNFFAPLFIAGLLMAMAFLYQSRAQEMPQHVEIVAQRFNYTPNEITLKKGVPVVIVLTSKDTNHGLKFKDLNLSLKVKKGTATEANFTPTEAGNFVGQCSVFCGSGHGSMKMTIHVTE